MDFLVNHLPVFTHLSSTFFFQRRSKLTTKLSTSLPPPPASAPPGVCSMRQLGESGVRRAPRSEYHACRVTTGRYSSLKHSPRCLVWSERPFGPADPAELDHRAARLNLCASPLFLAPASETLINYLAFLTTKQNHHLI